MYSNDPQTIVDYWHAVELLQPQAVPKIDRRRGPYGSFFHDVPCARLVAPWEPESVVNRQVLPRRHEWSHRLYAHLYDNRLVADALAELYGADLGYREPTARESAVFSAKFTMDGRLVENSFVLSTEAWFVGRALAGKDWTSGFKEDEKVAAAQAVVQLQGQVTAHALRDYTQWVLIFLGVVDLFSSVPSPRMRFRSQPVRPDRPVMEDDPLNSFLLDDLMTVADRVGHGLTSEPLNQYLRRHEAMERLQVDDDAASSLLIDRLLPQSHPDSCWPSKRHLGLVHSQQLAVNTVMAQLGEGQGLIGINGPPGTGKTTLLRDLIAAIVTQRADALSSLRRASDGFVRDGREEGNDAGAARCAYRLDPSLFGFEIVVASSNNGAVENVTLELPQRDRIDEAWLPDAEHFAELGELVTGKPAWGLISAALGNKANRTAFVNRYFHGQRSRRSEVTKAQEEDDSGDSEFDATSRSPEQRMRDDDRSDGFLIRDLFDLSDAVADVGEELGAPSVQNGEHCAGKPESLPAANDGLIEATPEAPDGMAAEGPDETGRGLLTWLGEQAALNAGRTPEEKISIWRQAVGEYEATKRRAEAVSADAGRMRDLLRTLAPTRAKIAEAEETVQAVHRELATARQRLQFQETAAGIPAASALREALNALSHHQSARPGVWANLRTLWGASRTWQRTMQQLQSEHDLARFDFDRTTRQKLEIEAEVQQLEQQLLQARQAVDGCKARVEALVREAIDLASACGADHLLAWLRGGVIGKGDEIELAEPWRIAGWRQARAAVFVQALKLNRTFLALEASRMRSNLSLINAQLTGASMQGYSRDAIRSIWASLFIVVPVLSSTFASFARSFGTLGPAQIGWLFVDEAGQAPPQAAVGALWRARRAVLVGDPLQLKPIVTVSDAVLEHMRTRYRVDPHWLPNRQSAQTLADQATSWGRLAGPADSKHWVGLPLVVHRRCDRPMYELANRIAYDGAMVSGTMAPDKDNETRASLPTGWIQASGPSDGNWVPAEGTALKALLTHLRDDGVTPDQISVITPFRAVSQQLQRALGKRMTSGTIHTMQGKEAPVVILVLGGNTEGSGARDWAVSEPNLLNVAATRAQRRLYVIGDRDDWQHRALFGDVMDLLPLQDT